MGGNDYKTKSSLSAAQEPVAQAMFEIFKSGLSQGLPTYPGSQGVQAFSPQATQQTFQSRVGEPMGDLWRSQFAPLVGPSARGYAQGRYGETMAGLSAGAGRAGEQQAYQEWQRTQPTGTPMNLGQAMLGQQYTATYQPEPSGWGQAGLAAANAAAMMMAYRNMEAEPDLSAWEGTSTAPTSPWRSDRYFYGY